MRFFTAGMFTLSLAGAAQAQGIGSAYTELDSDRDCAVFSAAQEGDGDWRNLVCSGYKGYPVFIYYSDVRESLFYGFPTQGDLAPTWESFSAFNNAGPRIEWRIEKDGDRERPFAAIHRWFVADANDPEEQIEVLVVKKVGQIGEWEGCAVGYVVASGNEGANEKARRIADDQARDFVCGTDQPAMEAGEIPLPDLTHGG